MALVGGLPARAKSDRELGKWVSGQTVLLWKQNGDPDVREWCTAWYEAIQEMSSNSNFSIKIPTLPEALEMGVLLELSVYSEGLLAFESRNYSDERKNKLRMAMDTFNENTPINLYRIMKIPRMEITEAFGAPAVVTSFSQVLQLVQSAPYTTINSMALSLIANLFGYDESGFRSSEVIKYENRPQIPRQSGEFINCAWASNNALVVEKDGVLEVVQVNATNLGVQSGFQGQTVGFNDLRYTWTNEQCFFQENLNAWTATKYGINLICFMVIVYSFWSMLIFSKKSLKLLPSLGAPESRKYDGPVKTDDETNEAFAIRVLSGKKKIEYDEKLSFQDNAQKYNLELMTSHKNSSVTPAQLYGRREANGLRGWLV